MIRELWVAVRLTVALTALTGLAYPLAVTALAQTFFPAQAKGSLIRDAGGRIVGSRLVGQAFDDPRYFWGRGSATAGAPYNAAASGGSNLGPSNPALVDAVARRIDALRMHDLPQVHAAPIPVDLVTASASGLDPHISPASAAWQAGRVARARGLDPATVAALVARHTEGPWLGVFGERRVNVLAVNLALDDAAAVARAAADALAPPAPSPAVLPGRWNATDVP